MKERQKDWSLKDRLVGEELNSIQFVMDYLQIHFNEKGITCYIWPDLNINNDIFKFGDANYRNELCKLIGKIVSDIYILDNDLLVIEFMKGDRIQLNINPDNSEIVTEIAVFWDDDGNWAIFE